MNDSLEFNVELNAYNGSLEVLLDLAKSQKVDLLTLTLQRCFCYLKLTIIFA